MKKLYGVNVAVADFGNTLPGVLGQDYAYPVGLINPPYDLPQYKYFTDKKLILFRIPFKWERLQNSAMGDLSQPDIDGLTKTLDVIHAAGGKAILDLHNYARYYNTPLTKSDAPKLADVWVKLAKVFKDHPALWGYELMNEPHDIPEGADGWNYLAQHATDAIRTIDTNTYILIPGYDWQSADRWQTSNPNLNITGDKLIYSAHAYFDTDASGQYTSGAATDVNIGVTRVNHFIQWLEANKLQGMITEYGISWADASWQPVLDNFMQALEQSTAIIGGTYWAAGPWWGSYVTTLEPTNGVDRAPMAILEKYPSIDDTQPVVVAPIPPTVTTSTPPPVATTPIPTGETPPPSTPIIPTPQPVIQNENKYIVTVNEFILIMCFAAAFGILVALDLVEVFAK